jgi:hypothetical protein
MAFTVTSNLNRSLFWALTSSALVFGLAPASILAQSAAAFDTRLYQQTVPSTMAATNIQHPQDAGLAEVTSNENRVPAPLVMFRANPPPLRALDEPASIPATLIATPPIQPPTLTHPPQWDPGNTSPLIAPPSVAGSTQEVSGDDLALARSNIPVVRGPFRAIVEDTGIAVVRTLPQAVANALPWVDRRRKDEPFEAVLTRVADELSRSAAQDPAWALSAQREIRSLARRLDTLPAPAPRLIAETGTQNQVDNAFIDNRPFKPRPIWPGASGRPEQQVRPNSIITVTNEQEGPRVGGVAARYVPSEIDSEGPAVRPLAATQQRPDATRPSTHRTRR